MSGLADLTVCNFIVMAGNEQQAQTIIRPVVEDGAALLPESKPLGQVVKRWPQSSLSVGRARACLYETLRGWGLLGLSGAAALVLSELVTNAITHGQVDGRYIETWFVWDRNGVRIEVHDAGDQWPVVRKAAKDDERGRGLALVDALVGPEGWGVSERDGVGKRVWARLALGHCGGE